MEHSSPQTYQEYFLKPGYIFISRTPTLISTVLGSSVSVCLWDREREYGGMNHFLYPSTRVAREATARYGNVAVRTLLRLLLDEGSRERDLEAQIFGGAHPPDAVRETAEVGQQNLAVSRQVLSRFKIPIVSEDVGGTKGRKLIYNTFTNEMAVFRVERLRASDWYPYVGDR